MKILNEIKESIIHQLIDAIYEYKDSANKNFKADDHETRKKIFVDFKLNQDITAIKELYSNFKLNEEFRELTLEQYYSMVDSAVKEAKKQNPIEFNTNITSDDKNRKINSSKIEIELLISNSIYARNDYPEESCEIGIELMEELAIPYSFLKSELGKESIIFKEVSNNIVDELSQCILTYFEFIRKDYTEPDPDFKLLMEKTLTLAEEGLNKKEIEKTIRDINDWIKDINRNREYKDVESEIFEISDQIKKLENENKSITAIENFILTCLPCLDKIKRNKGNQNEFYLKLSNTVVVKTIDSLNQILISILQDMGNNVLFGQADNNLKFIIERTIKHTKTIGTLEMYEETRINYKNNLKELRNVAEHFSIPF